MKKSFVSQIFVLLLTLLVYVTWAWAQDSVKDTPVTKRAAVKTTTGKPKYVNPSSKQYPINKLVQGVRLRYYPHKADEEVAAIIYANPESYNKILDRIYNDNYDGKSLSKEAFYEQVKRKYGDPFSKSVPLKTAAPAPVVSGVKPPVDTAKKAAVNAVPANPVPDNSLNGQYQFLLSKLYRYQEPLVAPLWKSVSDTLNVNRRKLQAAQSKVTTQAKMIDSLNTELTGKNQNPSTSKAGADTIDVLGISLSKTVYNLIVWGLVLVFAITAFIVIVRSGSYSREAKYRIKLYSELEEEFKAYKTKANDKEIKLARELQTERNKLDELLGR